MSLINSFSLCQYHALYITFFLSHSLALCLCLVSYLPCLVLSGYSTLKVYSPPARTVLFLVSCYIRFLHPPATLVAFTICRPVHPCRGVVDVIQGGPTCSLVSPKVSCGSFCSTVTTFLEARCGGGQPSTILFMVYKICLC